MHSTDLLLLAGIAALFVLAFCGFKFFVQQRFFTAFRNAAYVTLCLTIAIGGFFSNFDNLSLCLAIEGGCLVFLLSKYGFKARLLRALGLAIICVASLAALSAFMAASQPGSGRGEGDVAVLFILPVWLIAVGIAALLLRIDKKITWRPDAVQHSARSIICVSLLAGLSVLGSIAFMLLDV